MHVCIHKCHNISAARLGPLSSTFGKRSVEVFVLKWKSNAHFRNKTGLLLQLTLVYLLSFYK